MENVLITGTTSGFGKAFAEKFASMGNNIILVSRNMQKLKQQQLYLQNQYHVTVKFIAYDLSRRYRTHYRISLFFVSKHIY